MPSRARSECGSASLWLLSIALVCWFVAGAVVVTAEAVVARHKAASAADLAALAGAEELARARIFAASPPAESACGAASSAAAANGARLVTCVAAGSVVDVVAAIPLTGLTRLAALAGTVSAHARAGSGS